MQKLIITEDEIKANDNSLTKPVTVAHINHDTKEITAVEGYCIPHMYGRRNARYAKKKGYKFNN